MLIVIAKAKVGSGTIEPGREAIAAMVEASLAEQGCLDYTFTTDVLDPGTMLIVEKWVDDAALAAHFQTPHMAAFNAAISDLDVTLFEALKYQSDDGAPLM